MICAGRGSFFTRLFALVLGAIVLSHLLFGLLLYLMPGHHNPPPPPPPPPEAAAQAQPQAGNPPYPPPRREPPFWPRILFPLAVQLGTLTVAAWLGARLLARPVQRLATAAAELGDNLERPPLPETGPKETRQAAAAFNRMQARILKQIQERSQFLAAVSHDLRTPLTRMRLRAARVDDAEARSALIADVEEMSGMIEATLEFLRGEAQPDPEERLDVQALLESLLDDLKEQHARVDLRGQAAPIRAHSQSLRRALSNLLTNALRYGGCAHVALEDSAERLVIVIRDEGPGIPEAELENVQQPFVRLETSRSRATGGTGLGLAIARDIAQRHGGRLVLANRPEGGLEARLELPRA